MHSTLKGLKALAEANEAYENGRKAFKLNGAITDIDGWDLPYATEWKNGWRDMKRETEELEHENDFQ